MVTTVPAPENPDDSITRLLNELGHGNREAESKLVRQVYHELRLLARLQMSKERPDHTLQPTALVNEVYLRLVKEPIHWENRAHFFAVASQVMRRILVDHARKHRARKRGGDAARVPLSGHEIAQDAGILDVLELNELLDRLAAFDPKLAKLVELHYFSGLSHDEIAKVMGVSERTVSRWWTGARAWLRANWKKTGQDT